MGARVAAEQVHWTARARERQASVRPSVGCGIGRRHRLFDAGTAHQHQDARHDDRRDRHGGRRDDQSLGAVPRGCRRRLEVPCPAVGQLGLPRLRGRGARGHGCAVARGQHTRPRRHVALRVLDYVRRNRLVGRRLLGRRGHVPLVGVVAVVVVGAEGQFLGGRVEAQVSGFGRRSGLCDQRAAEPSVVVVGVVQLVCEVQVPESSSLGHASMLAPATSSLPLRRRRRGHRRRFRQRIFSPYTRSTARVISTLRSATITDRYSSQSGCSPAAAR